jgi:hypothetical protein
MEAQTLPPLKVLVVIYVLQAIIVLKVVLKRHLVPLVPFIQQREPPNWQIACLVQLVITVDH